MRLPFKTWLLLSGVLAALLLLAVACGGDDAEESAPVEPAPAAPIDVAAIVQQALAAQPQGASSADVAAAVQSALAAQPGVTQAQVAQAIAGALEDRPGVTETQVATAIAEALSAAPGITERQVADTIAAALLRQTPGLTEEQVGQAIADALANRPGVSQEDIASIVGAAVSGAVEELTRPFRIGVMESVTGPGETYGKVAVNAKQLAVDEINAAGGINGRMLELIIEDEKCNAQDAITAYRKLTDVDGVKIILGTSCSGAMLGAAPLAEEDGVVMFSGLATNPQIADAGDYIFRTSMNDAQVGIDTGNVLWADGVRDLATITESTDYAEGVRSTTVEQFQKVGGTLVGEERYASDVTDFRSQLTKLFSENPDGLHIAAQSEFTGGTIVKQARELGFEGPIYGEVVVIGTTAIEIAGDAATGVKAIVADLDPSNSTAQGVLRNFRAKYDYVTLQWYLGSAYDDVYIAAECLRRTNDDQDADGFRDCLYDITWSGAIGTDYSFDERGEVVGLSNVVVAVLPPGDRTEVNQGYRVLGPAPGTPTMAMSDEPFRVGVMESVTGPGETYGKVAVNAKQLAVDEINAAGGINGRMLELIIEDEKCNAQDSITAYRKLTDVDGVKIILGTSCSGAMLGAAPLAEEDGVVMFSGLATNPQIADAGDYIFRTSMNDAQVGIDTGNVLWADGIRNLATITESTDYAEGVRSTTVAQFEKLGGTLVGEERYASDVTDFRSQLTKLFSESPDGLHIAAQSEFTGGTIVKQSRELGYEGPIYGEIVVIGTTAIEIAGDAATGVKAIVADLDPNNSRALEVLANFRAKYDYVTLQWYLGSAYDDVYITAECLRRTNDDQDADGFRDCLYDITWSGAIGTDYSFDERGEVVGLSNVVVEVLPTGDRTDANQGYRVLGGAPTE